MVANPLFVFNKGRYIIEYIRNNRKLEKRIIRKFYPYFYAVDQNGTYTTIDGKAVKKIFVSHPKLVREKREKFEHYEADIPYTLRYVLDQYKSLLDGGDVWKVEPFKYIFIDIEVKDSLDYINTPQPVVCATLYCNFSKSYLTCVLCNEEGIYQKGDWFVALFKDEAKMLKFLLEFIAKTIDPDMILAWNVQYDMNYLLNRAKKLGIDVSILARDNGDVIQVDNKVFIFGRLVVDYKELVSHVIKLQSYSLENVAKELNLGIEKKERKSISQMSIIDLIHYNKRDVEILVALEKKYKIIKFWDEIRRILGVDWYGFYRLDGISPKRIIDIALLRLAHSKNIILPTASSDVSDESYKGGYVVTPTERGVIENVVVFDFKSTYPNIIRTYNISYETLDDQGEILTPLGYRFRKKPRGLLAEFMDKLIQLRDFYKKKMKEEPENKDIYDMRQQAIKVILNSGYGVFGYRGFRLYRKEVAETITAFARELLKFVISKVEQVGYKVIYGDTDSVFIKFNINDRNKILEEAEYLLAKLNDTLSEFAEKWNVKEHYHQLEFKYLFSKVIFYGNKKNYIGLAVNEEGEWIDPKIVHKGTPAIRSDSAQITQQVFDQVVRMLLDGKSIADCIRYIEKVKEDIRKGLIPIEKLVIRNNLTKKEYVKKGKHVKAIENAVKLGLIDSIPFGEKVCWIYTSNNLDVIGVPESKLDLLKHFKINYRKMEERWFKSVIEFLKSI